MTMPGKSEKIIQIKSSMLSASRMAISPFTAAVFVAGGFTSLSRATNLQ